MKGPRVSVVQGPPSRSATPMIGPNDRMFWNACIDKLVEITKIVSLDNITLFMYNFISVYVTLSKHVNFL